MIISESTKEREREKEKGTKKEIQKEKEMKEVDKLESALNCIGR